MDPDVIYVRTDADQEECARLMARYNIMALPVLDKTDHMVGVITVDNLVEVLEDEATEDIQRLGGAALLDRPYLDTQVTRVAWKRLGWLLLLFISLPRRSPGPSRDPSRTAPGPADGCGGLRPSLNLGNAPTPLAMAVALSIFTIVVWANGMGALLPLLAARVGIDLAIAKLILGI